MSEKLVYEAFGRAVALRRKELDLTQADLAGRIGMSRASIANIESGRQNVLLHHAYRLAEALDLPSIAALLPAAPKSTEEHLDMLIADAKVAKDELSARQRQLVGDLVAAAMAKRPASKAGA